VRRRATGLIVFLVPFLLLFGGRALVAEPFAVPSDSMAPTVQRGDQVVANKLAYRLGAPRIGDVVVFHDPRGGREVLLKRVVALAGQRVEIRDGVLFVDGRPRHEAYVDHDLVDGFFFGPARVAPDGVFVLGDNRGDSADSREFGSVPRSDLIGRVDLTL
jgi:signal peptidase I